MDYHQPTPALAIEKENVSKSDLKCVTGISKATITGTKNLLQGFPFYTLGRFAQDVCVGTNSLIGTCVLGDECDDLGGTQTGRVPCSGANSKQASCCIGK